MAAMIWLLTAALASDSGVQRLYDRELSCGFSVDPPAPPSSCVLGVRASLPSDERPTWALSVGLPGRLYVSYHMPAIDWGHVYRIELPRAFDPVLLSVGMVDGGRACPGERLQFVHVLTERGFLTHQVCAGHSYDGVSEVLLESHRKLPTDQWIPLWVHHPRDASASDVKTWFIVQIFVATTGTAPARPPQHPYQSVEALRAALPRPLPPRKTRMLTLPFQQPNEKE